MDMGHAAATLRWWAEAGVDVLVDDLPRDWLSAAPGLPRAPLAAPAAPRVDLPDDLAAFQAWLADPAIWPTLGARRAAPAGDPAAGLMLLADMPEADDPRVPLGGALGRLLDRMLAAIGRDRSTIYLATLAPARPAGGRLPPALRDDLAVAARRHVALAKPRLLLLLGQAAVATFGLEWPAARGRLHDLNHDGGTVRAIATFHPRFLLAHPACKADAWADLRLLLRDLDA